LRKRSADIRAFEGASCGADLDELVVGGDDGASTVEHGTGLGDGGSVREDRGKVCVEERERDGGGSNCREHLERSRAEGLQAFEVWRPGGESHIIFGMPYSIFDPPL
jgi:hypothetical protein